MALSNFNPQAILEKHGWKTGSGLGKSEHGIREAIRVDIKMDRSGIGHDSSEKFTYHWWEHVYNNAAKSIQVVKDEDGVSIKKTGQVDFSIKKKPKFISKKPLLYGNFVKSATLRDGGLEVKESSDESESDSSSSNDERTVSKLTDEELLKACEGRTGYKGARHGLNLRAKLLRIQQHNEQFQLVKKDAIKATSQSEHLVVKTEKKPEVNTTTSEENTHGVQVPSEDIVKSGNECENNSCKKKKQKRKREEYENNFEENAESKLCMDGATRTSKKHKKKHQVQEEIQNFNKNCSDKCDEKSEVLTMKKTKLVGCDGVAEENISSYLPDESEPRKVHKKKFKEGQDVQQTKSLVSKFQDMSDDLSEVTLKKYKKRKHNDKEQDLKCEIKDVSQTEVNNEVPYEVQINKPKKVKDKVCISAEKEKETIKAGEHKDQGINISRKRKKNAEQSSIDNEAELSKELHAEKNCQHPAESDSKKITSKTKKTEAEQKNLAEEAKTKSKKKIVGNIGHLVETCDSEVQDNSCKHKKKKQKH